MNADVAMSATTPPIQSSANTQTRFRLAPISIAPFAGADPLVVELFAWLHDSCRWDDFADREHGERAARFALELRGSAFELEDSRFELLLAACRGHSHGGTEGEVTVLTCWDADRLDLGRVGIEPHPDRLCTDTARDPDVLAWAYAGCPEEVKSLDVDS